MMNHICSKSIIKKMIVCSLVALPLFSFADKKNKIDEIRPQIQLKNLEQKMVVLRGENFTMKACFQDDKELDSYQFSITKGGIDSDLYSDTFSISKQVDTEGKSFPSISGTKEYELNFEVRVHEKTIVGDYYITFYLKDKAGNENIKKQCFYVSR